jgi:hypothetical protein
MELAALILELLACWPAVEPVYWQGDPGPDLYIVINQAFPSEVHLLHAQKY